MTTSSNHYTWQLSQQTGRFSTRGRWVNLFIFSAMSKELSALDSLTQCDLIPAAAGTRRTKEVWNHFLKTKRSDRPERHICYHCWLEKKVVFFSKTTSVYSREYHLRVCHGLILGDSSSRKRGISSFSSPPCPEAKKRKIDRAIFRLFTKKNLSFSLVREELFVDLLQIASEQEYHPVCVEKLQYMVLDESAKTNKVVRSNLRDIEPKPPIVQGITNPLCGCNRPFILNVNHPQIH